MKIQEAYKVLESSSDISDEDLKIKYKDMAKKYHPDIYKKEPDKFKKINEAYQFILDYRKNPEKYEPNMKNGFWGRVPDIANDFFINFGFENEWSKPKEIKPIFVSINLNFKESVLGCSKEINYTRNIKCKDCQGAGIKRKGNGCETCDGFGRSTINNKGMIFQTKCSKCQGKNVTQNTCDKCKGKCVINENKQGNIHVPAGIKNEEILRVNGAGNFVGRTFFADEYTDLHIKVHVKSYKDMYIENNNVISKLNISLLEALEGKEQEIETIYGNKNVTIPPKTKHLDQIKIPKCGVNNTNGMHVIKLFIEYPQDVTDIIGVLKNDVHN